jgi:hypothetical protein
MKVLTLTQPWATLVAIGAKQIETRSWSTSYRGPLAIHAAKGLAPVGGRAGLYDLAFSDPDGYFYSALHQANVFCIDDLPLGAIVATCELVCCKLMNIPNLKRGWYNVAGADWPLTDQERAFGDYTPGRFAWLLANIRALPKPIPAKGALGLWEWEGEL